MVARDVLRSSYEKTPYHDQCFPEFDLSRLIGFAQLFGLRPPDAEKPRLRVLDLGCASGLHIREQARRHPNADFTGIDFARTEVASGQKAIIEDGLENVELIAADLREVELEAGTYDVILCHGTFSWVPDEVKERLLMLCRQGLRGDGLAAVAYLTYPGWKQREAIRELLTMRDHAERPPEERVRESALMLRFLHAGYSAHEHDPHARSLKAVVESMQQSATNAFLHDELGQIHDPCYFLQFVEWAEECGLQYLAETDLGSMSTEGLDPSAHRLLQELSPGFLETQQLVDFVVNRSGRSSLLVRGDVDFERHFTPQRLNRLHLATSWWHVTPANAPDGSPARFESDQGRQVRIEHPCILSLFRELTDRRNEPIPCAELQETALRRGHDREDAEAALTWLVHQGMAEPRAQLG
jgi:SAM-dependent methyltransferase